VRAAVKVNDNIKDYFVKNVESTLGGLHGKTVAVLGLSFKPDTDDVRDSRAMELVDRLVKKGAIVKATDPIALENARKVVPESDKLIYEENVYKSIGRCGLCSHHN